MSDTDASPATNRLAASYSALCRVIDTGEAWRRVSPQGRRLARAMFAINDALYPFAGGCDDDR